MTDNKQRIFGLDLLRAYAIFCVVYGHGYVLLKDNIPYSLYSLPLTDGVTVFFVLSGFLIGRILLRTVMDCELDRKTLFEFWIRRWFRTLPAYFFVLIFVILFYIYLGSALPQSLQLYFIFSQNINRPHPSFFAEAWSLAIEEWFYIILPISLYITSRFFRIDKDRAIIFVTLFVLASSALYRYYLVQKFSYHDTKDWDEFLRKQVLTRMDSLMFGVLGAYLSIRASQGWTEHKALSLLLGIALLVADKILSTSSENIFYQNYVHLTLAPLGTLLMLPFLSSWRATHGLAVKFITFLA